MESGCSMVCEFRTLMPRERCGADLNEKVYGGNDAVMRFSAAVVAEFRSPNMENTRWGCCRRYVA